jgi:transposase
MKFVTPLNEATRKQLEAINHDDTSFQRRRRAQAILLNNRGYKIDSLAAIFACDRDTVSAWLTQWEEHAFDGLNDAPRSGRPRKTTSKQDRQIVRSVERHPQQIKQAAAALKKKKIDLSLPTIRRRLREAGLSFRRIRKRLAKEPDPEEYKRAEKRLAVLEKQQEQGKIEVAYVDASGFSLKASQPMAWQHPERPIWIRAQGHYQRLNVVGFLRSDCHFRCTVFEKNLDDRCVIAAIDEYIKRRSAKSKPLFLVIDNAPIHHTDEVREAEKRWRRKNVRLEFLPTYSSTLNRIEILWKFIKYHWLPIEAYSSFVNLRSHLFAILNAIGTKYRITFEN